MNRSLRLHCLLCCLALAGCDAYDAGLIEPSAAAGGTGGVAGSRPPYDAAVPPVDGGDEDGGMCSMQGIETCNLVDDDCDGDTDEDTQQGCQAVIVNGVAECVELLGEARCVLRRCNEGFSNCDGDPTNGCEPYCMCHVCPDEDAGTGEADGGT